jgi:hypothetical protein
LEPVFSTQQERDAWAKERAERLALYGQKSGSTQPPGGTTMPRQAEAVTHPIARNFKTSDEQAGGSTQTAGRPTTPWQPGVVTDPNAINLDDAWACFKSVLRTRRNPKPVADD